MPMTGGAGIRGCTMMSEGTIRVRNEPTRKRTRVGVGNPGGQRTPRYPNPSRRSSMGRAYHRGDRGGNGNECLRRAPSEIAWRLRKC